MKVGDLVKFKDRDPKSTPIGIVRGTNTLEEDPHPSQPGCELAYIEWACPYTPKGNYQMFLLEVINEN
jgi:hypothetical protein